MKLNHIILGFDSNAGRVACEPMKDKSSIKGNIFLSGIFFVDSLDFFDQSNKQYFPGELDNKAIDLENLFHDKL